ncbi:MAG: diguanylate cyclase, partial [Actinomycetota bacterium]|nr:diguanylate cyclase [Actinomycetota bacterium]
MPAPAPDGRSHLVLIVDDDRRRVEQISLALAAHGYELLRAAGTVAALSEARQHRPAIVILGEAGSAQERRILCRTLRSDWRTGNPLVLAITSRDAADALDVEADDFIVGDPLDPARLLVRVAAAVDRVRAMRGASPLTGLPGNIAIDEEIRRRFEDGRPLALLYADLDNFKAYNDHYGFLRGDELIRGLADVLRSAAEARPDTFVGHIGGDDFVIVTLPELAEGMAHEIVERLSEFAPSCYDPRDAARGWIELDDRRGQRHRYPLVTISIGLATNRNRLLPDHRALVDVATELKQHAKQQAGNAIAVDRRTDSRHPTTHHLVAGSSGPGRQRVWRPGGLGLATRRHLRRAAVAMLLAVVLAGNATVVLASQARPGLPLWPLKTRLEAVRVAVERDPDDRVTLHLGYASRRIGELVSLLAMDADAVLAEQVIANLNAHLVSAADGLALLERSGAVVPARLAEIKRLVAHNVEVLGEVREAHCQSAPTGAAHACRGLEQALQVATRSPARAPGPPTQPARPARSEPADASKSKRAGPAADTPSPGRPRTSPRTPQGQDGMPPARSRSEGGGAPAPTKRAKRPQAPAARIPQRTPQEAGRKARSESHAPSNKGESAAKGNNDAKEDDPAKGK